MTPRNVTKRSLPIALALLAILALLAPSWPGARLSVSTGTVEIGRGEPPVWKLAAAGEVLAAGDRVRTGENGRAEVTHGGSVLRLYPNSLLRLPEQARQVEMEKGKTLFDVLHNGEPFEVRTPEVVVSVKGTRFGVSLDGDDAEVSVFRGLVGVRGDDTGALDETLVYAGFAARGHDQFELTWHGGDDPWDGWSRGDTLPAPARGAVLRDARRAAVASVQDLPAGPKHESGDGRPGKPDGIAVLPPAAIANPPAILPPVRDAVADVTHPIGGALNENYVNGVLDEVTGGLLTVNFVSGSGQSGPDVVQVLDGTTTWVFDKGELKDIVEGEDSLPNTLVTVLNDQGLEQALFTNQLLGLFRRGGSSD